MAAAALVACMALVQTRAANGDPLVAGWTDVPMASRPWCYWWWVNGHVDKPTITADLEAMKRLGIGGSFAEFHPIDFERDTVLLGHDGPHHLSIAAKKPVLRSLKKYHGKPGKRARAWSSTSRRGRSR